jgi:hypothetical protein
MYLTFSFASLTIEFQSDSCAVQQILPGKYMLNVSTSAVDGHYADAAHALGSFVQRLAPLVVLQPACTPI